MNDTFVLQAVLAFNAVTMVGSVVVAVQYYLASRELHEALHKQSEQDGERYAQSFQAQLWNEKKTEMEKELNAYKKAHEKVCKDLVEANERYNGLEQAYHEARSQLTDNLIAEAQAEEKPKRKSKK